MSATREEEASRRAARRDQFTFSFNPSGRLGRFEARESPFAFAPMRIPGDYRPMAIPVPIPNTVVKHEPPMILLRARK